MSLVVVFQCLSLGGLPAHCVLTGHSSVSLPQPSLSFAFLLPPKYISQVSVIHTRIGQGRPRVNVGEREAEGQDKARPGSTHCYGHGEQCSQGCWPPCCGVVVVFLL